MDKKALVGWVQIAEYFGWSEKKIRMKKTELLQDGVIFYAYLGRPPRIKVQAFPRHLEEWSRKKNKKNEIM